MDVRPEQRRAHHASTTWHSTRDNQNERAPVERAPCCHLTFDYGYIQPMSLRQGRVQTDISERTKQEVLSAAPREGFTAVRNICLDLDHSMEDRCLCSMERG
jgi:hypothetical protein